MADVNIFQGAIFHDGTAEEFDAVESEQLDIQTKSDEPGKPQMRKTPKPAAHRVSVPKILESANLLL